MAQTPATSAVPTRRRSLRQSGASAGETSARIRVLQANFMRRLSAKPMGASPALSTNLPQSPGTPDMSPYTLMKKIHNTAVEVSPVKVFKRKHVEDDVEPRRTSETSSVFELSTPTDEHESGRWERRHRRALPTQVNLQTLTQRVQQTLHGKDQPELEDSDMNSFSLKTPKDSEVDDLMGLKKRRNHTRLPMQRVNKEALSQALQQHLREEAKTAEEALHAPTTDLMDGWTAHMPLGEVTLSYTDSSHSKRVSTERSTSRVQTRIATRSDSVGVEFREADKYRDSLEGNGVPVIVDHVGPVIGIHLSSSISAPISSGIQSQQDSYADGTGAAELATMGKRGETCEETTSISQMKEAEVSSASLVDPKSTPHPSLPHPVHEDSMEEEEEEEMNAVLETDIDKAGPAGEALVPGRTNSFATSSNEEEEDNGSSIDEEAELQMRKLKMSSKPSPALHTPAFFTTNKLDKGKKKGALKIKKPASKRDSAQKIIKMPLKDIKNIFQRYAPCRLSKQALLAIAERLPSFLEQMLDDLEVFACHAGRKTITIADVELLMKRQRYVTDKMPLVALIREHLPIEMRVKLLDIILGKVLPPLPTKHD